MRRADFLQGAALVRKEGRRSLRYGQGRLPPAALAPEKGNSSMMYLLMTAGIMGLSLFLISRLSRVCGLQLKGKALALAGILSTAIAGFLPVVAPFLTGDYYWKLSGLILVAAALVTAYNAHLLRLDARRAAQAETAAPPPATAPGEERPAAGAKPAPSGEDARSTAEALPAREPPSPQESPPSAPTAGTVLSSKAPRAQASPKEGPAPEEATTQGVPAKTPPAQKGVPPEASPAQRGAQAPAAAPAETPPAPENVPPGTIPAPKETQAPAAALTKTPPAQEEAPVRADPAESPAGIASPPAAKTAPEKATLPEEPPRVPESSPAAVPVARGEAPDEVACPQQTADAACEKELAALSSLDDFLDYAYAAQTREELPRALAAYREALRQYADDPYVPYLFIDLGNLCKQSARYADCIEVYRQGLELPIIAGNEAMAEEFRKNLLYLRLVYHTLKKHHALATPFSEIPQAYRAEIETAFQAALAMHSGR